MLSAVAASTRALCALFPGQGAQVVGMGKELVAFHPAASRVFEEVDEALKFGLSSLMWTGPLEELSQTEFAQPAVLACSIALTRVLEAAGKLDRAQVAVAAGHSVGEYSALVFAGAVTLADAAVVLRQRGQLMQMAAHRVGEPIAMSALMPSSAAAISDLCAAVSETHGSVSVANINSLEQVVISGTARGVAEVEARAKASRAARKCVRLNVSAPFHSPLLQPAANAFGHVLRATAFAAPSVPVISNVTTSCVSDAASLPELLETQVCAPVNWLGCMVTAGAMCESFVELGPGTVLSSLASRIHPDKRDDNGVAVGWPARTGPGTFE